MSRFSTIEDGVVGSLSLKDVQARIAILVTASFSLLASLVVVAITWYDNRRSKARISKQTGLFDFLVNKYPAYTLPYTLALASIVQESIFIASQTLMYQIAGSEGCIYLSQVSWVASWIVSCVLLIICLAFICRGLLPSRLLPRRIWFPFTCGLILAAVLVFTWLPITLKSDSNKICSMDPSQWVKAWSDVATTITTLLLALYFAGILVLAFHTRKQNKTSRQQKAIIYHFLYHLVLSTFILVFTLPCWVLSFLPLSPQISRTLAIVAIHIFGLANSLLFLILRGHNNDALMKWKPKVWEKRSSWSSFGISESAVAKQMFYPIDLERNNSSLTVHTNTIHVKSKLSRPPLTPTTYPRQEDAASARSQSHYSSRRPSSESSYTHISNDTFHPTTLDTTQSAHHGSNGPLSRPEPLFTRRIHHSSTPNSMPELALTTNKFPRAYNAPNLSKSTTSLPIFAAKKRHQRYQSTSSLNQKRSLDSLVLNPPARCSCSHSRFKSDQNPSPISPVPRTPISLTSSHQSYIHSPRSYTHQNSSLRRARDKSLPPIPRRPSSDNPKIKSRSSKQTNSNNNASPALGIWPSNTPVLTPSPGRAYQPPIAWL
ncbi:hypothetical protein FQN57_006358 [Myotisia sp. PD_48]|nr:hypothetical protein FQN57_006358 [Myotisia sp. PD_48]